MEEVIKRKRERAVQRMCEVFMCDHRGDRFCCHDCKDKEKCKNPCLNHPDRCGLLQERGRKCVSEKMGRRIADA